MGLEHRDKFELFWVRHQPFLLDKGYLLRSRYKPDWTPSWLLPENAAQAENPRAFEDGYIPPKYYRVMDATRLSDGRQVVLKKSCSKTPELDMLQFFSDTNLRSEWNRTIPLLDVIALPAETTGSEDQSLVDILLVLPKFINFNYPPFHCHYEILECMRDVFQGVAFMHSLDITHGDIGPYNILMDPTSVCPDGYHFASRRAIDGIQPLQHRPRCEVSPVSYYLIDLEGSQWFPEGREAARISANVKSQVKSAPELSQPQQMINPFALDIYNLGKTFLDILVTYDTADIFAPILERMVADKASARLTASEAVKEIMSLHIDSDLLYQPLTWSPF